MGLLLNLSQKQTQTHKLIMTQQMLQAIQLLQMNSQELEQKIEQELLENPFLEMEEGQEDAGEEDMQNADSLADFDGAEQSADPRDLHRDDVGFDTVDINLSDLFDCDSHVYASPAGDQEEHDFTEFTAAQTSLFDHLSQQLRLSSLEGDDLRIGEFIIGCVDDDGYMSEPLEEIAEELTVRVEDLQRVLRVLQEFDPAGVFARNLAECLLLQLQDQGLRTPVAVAVLGEYFEMLKKRKFREIARISGIDEGDVSALFDQIRRLEPKPGRMWSKEQVRGILPDVHVKEFSGAYMYFVNEGNSSRLRISKLYRNMLSDQKHLLDAKEREYARERLASAKMLLKNIERRKSTVLRVTEAIFEHQREFLTEGIAALRPLTLREIAGMVGMHEATISRVTSDKYVETPQGLFELKFFFSSCIGSDTGEETSSRAIKDLIAELVESEDPHQPLCDEDLAENLQSRGFQIARRTVTKYREGMKILPVKIRRRLPCHNLAS